MPFDLVLLVYLSACLAVAGFAKGVSGIGLPVIAVPFMALMVDLRLAVALMPVSIVGSNIVNAAGLRHDTSALRRFWPILLTIPLGTALGATLLHHGDTDVLKTVIGLTVIGFVGFQVVRPRWRLSDRAARWLAPVAGLAGGVLGGTTSIFAPPLVIFLLAAGLAKELFVATVSVYYILGVLVLSVFLSSFEILDLEMLAWSAAAFLPVLVGQLLGAAARQRISEAVFRNTVFVLLLAAGVTMLVR